MVDNEHTSNYYSIWLEEEHHKSASLWSSTAGMVNGINLATFMVIQVYFGNVPVCQVPAVTVFSRDREIPR